MLLQLQVQTIYASPRVLSTQVQSEPWTGDSVVSCPGLWAGDSTAWGRGQMYSGKAKMHTGKIYTYKF